MACISNTVLLDLSAAMTDSFEGMGAYSRGDLLEDLRYWKLHEIRVGAAGIVRLVSVVRFVSAVGISLKI